MSRLGRIVDGFARRLAPRNQTTLRVCMDRRIAAIVRPLIDKLIASDENGATYRAALTAWHHSERPPLAFYQGSTSCCRIDGPIQSAGNHAFPLGGLILSPGVTAHLDPFEAGALRAHMMAAIERAILAWIADCGQRDWPRVDVAFDREAADRKAKAIIAGWLAQQPTHRTAGHAVLQGPDHG